VFSSTPMVSRTCGLSGNCILSGVRAVTLCGTIRLWIRRNIWKIELAFMPGQRVSLSSFFLWLYGGTTHTHTHTHTHTYIRTIWSFHDKCMQYTFIGQRPCQLVERRVNQRCENHLCSRYQGTVCEFSSSPMTGTEIFLENLVQTRDAAASRRKFCWIGVNTSDLCHG
jgi:hypothetical protein